MQMIRDHLLAAVLLAGFTLFCAIVDPPADANPSPTAKADHPIVGRWAADWGASTAGVATFRADGSCDWAMPDAGARGVLWRGSWRVAGGVLHVEERAGLPDGTQGPMFRWRSRPRRTTAAGWVGEYSGDHGSGQWSMRKP